MSRPTNIWFLASWLLLVVVASIGFFIQGRLINSVEQQQETLESQQDQLVTQQQEFEVLVSAVARDNERDREQLCDLMLTIAEEIEEPTGVDLTQEILASFRKEDIECRVRVNP